MVAFLFEAKDKVEIKVKIKVKVKVKVMERVVDEIEYSLVFDLFSLPELLRTKHFWFCEDTMNEILLLPFVPLMLLVFLFLPHHS